MLAKHFTTEDNVYWELQIALDNKTGMPKKFYVSGDMCMEVLQEEPCMVLNTPVTTWETGVQFPLKGRETNNG